MAIVEYESSGPPHQRWGLSDYPRVIGCGGICPNCHKFFGWVGDPATDDRTCHHCGHVIQKAINQQRT